MKAERGQLSQPNQPTQHIPVAPPKRPQTAARDLELQIWKFHIGFYG